MATAARRFELDKEEAYRALQDARQYVTDFDRRGSKAEAIYERLARASAMMRPWSTDGTTAQSKKAVEYLNEIKSILSEKIGPASRREFSEQGGKRHHTTKKKSSRNANAAKSVMLETMPDYLRGSHRAAGNWGVYPHNGAMRERVSRVEAEAIVAADTDGYDHIVTPRRAAPKAKPHHATKKAPSSKKTWHIFETGRSTGGDRWIAGPYLSKGSAEVLALRYMSDPPGRDSLRRSGVYIVKDHGP